MGADGGGSPGRAPVEPSGNEVLRWGLGCLVAFAALLGIAILALVIFVVLEPPSWVQVAIGIVLALSGAGLAWLVASALRQSSPETERGARRAE